jgi:hypothetical protein
VSSYHSIAKISFFHVLKSTIFTQTKNIGHTWYRLSWKHFNQTAKSSANHLIKFLGIYHKKDWVEHST